MSNYINNKLILRLALLFFPVIAGNIGVTTVTAQTDPPAKIKLPNTTIESVEVVPAGAFKLPAGTLVLPDPNRFGQAFGCDTCDEKNNIAAAVENRVERGIAPDTIIARKYKNDIARTDLARTRPLCPYPQVARYKGRGSIDEAANFACVKPE